MSFNPLSIRTVGYIGAPTRTPIALGIPVGDTPAMVPLTFQWSVYGVSQANPNVGVNFDLGIGSASRSLLNGIRGIYINNYGSNGSIYVYFPDTRHMVACPPYSGVWSPVVTKGLNGIVFGKNFTTNDPSQTVVEFYNIDTAPNVDGEIQVTYPQWRSSPQLGRGLNANTTGFASPAIGDQWQFLEQGSGSAQTQQTVLFGTPYINGGVITLTSLRLRYLPQGIMPAGLTVSQITTSLRSLGASGIFDEATFAQEQYTQFQYAPLIWDHRNLQVKLNAAEAWIFELVTSGAIAGNFAFHATYCYTGPGGGSIQTTGDFGLINNAIIPLTALVDSTLPYAGWRFVAPLTVQITSLQIRMGTIAGDYHAEVYTNSAGGNPDALIGTSQSITPSSSYSVNQFDFLTLPTINSGVTYWVVLVPDDPVANSARINLVNGVVPNIGGHASTIAGLATGQSGGTNYAMQLQYITL